MKTRKIKLIGIFIFLFLVFLPFSYFGFSFYRQKQLENGLRSDYNNNLRNIEEIDKEIKSEFQNLDMGDYEQRNRYEDLKLTQIGYYYLSLGDEYLMNKKYGNVLYRFFDVYGRKYAFIEIRQDMISTIWNSKGDCIVADYISKWEESGNKREGDWWNKFKKSEEYKEYLSRLLNKENRIGENVDEGYEKILKIEKPNYFSLRNFLIYDNIIDIDKKIVAIVYENLKNHKGENDYIAISFDVNFILFSSYSSINPKKFNLMKFILDTNHEMPVAFMPSYIYIDILKILILSILLAFIVTLFLNKYFKERKEI